MKIHLAGRAVRGDLLSCYTTSIATYMRQMNIDYLMALGTQLFLAVRDQPGSNLAFIHYHTPLRGDHSLPLVRRTLPSFLAAMERITAEWRRYGAVVIVGDTFSLSWQITYQRQHTPHWFLIDSVDEQASCVHIVDNFESRNLYGLQQAFSGWVPWPLLDMNLMSEQAFLERERYAFGDDEDPALIGSGGLQWFEALALPEVLNLTREHILSLLAASYLFHSGQQVRPDLAASGWVSGVEALRILAEKMQEHLNDPLFFAWQSDLWVIARNRQLFATVLENLGIGLNLPTFHALALWCQQEIVTRWMTLVQVVECNQQALQRGKSPKIYPVKILQQLVLLEYELTMRLGNILREEVSLNVSSMASPLATLFF